MEENIILYVCIATYNRCEILKKKLELLLGIDSDKFEVVVLDDASTDGTDEMLRNNLHPHDLVLGQFAEYGEMFQFKKIWSLAGTESFANNKSFLYKKGTIEDAWFSPKARTAEFGLFVEQIAKSSFNVELKKKRRFRLRSDICFIAL